MFKKGDVAYFKVASRSAKKHSPAWKFNGHGFGILLGHVPHFAPDITPGFLMQSMGSIGFVSFDDIGEFFGTEVGADCVKKFEEKYWVKKSETETVNEKTPNNGESMTHADPEPAREDAVVPTLSKLLDKNGNPMVNHEVVPEPDEKLH